MDQTSEPQSSHQQAGKLPSSLITPQEQRQPEQIWKRLSPVEQQLVLRPIVLIGRSLLNELADRAKAKEEPDDQP
jgi:hypothetical protein